MGLKRWCILAVLLAAAGTAADTRADEPACNHGRHNHPILVNLHLAGRIVDYTANHGHDRRIWSRSLHQKRDLYVYLPPGYDSNEAYPVMIFLHGFAVDERIFLKIVRTIDDAIVNCKCPPMIVAAPDGSLDGHGCCEQPGSFWINSNAGYYEDFVLQDVWDHLCHNYSIRPDRESHILAGISMGGFGAFNLGIRHRDAFGIVAGIFPPLNLRWQDSHGNPRAKFDPRCWSWRTSFDEPREVIARFGLATVRLGDLIGPVFGEGDAATAEIIQNNPIELVDRTRLRNGELQMFIGYAGADEFNVDAQVESFLYLCKHRGIGVCVAYDPRGHHNSATAAEFAPAFFEFLSQRLGTGCCPSGPCDRCVPERPGRPKMLP
jgi:poly(3-hydroxybutyrate) depolymerase